MTSLPLSFSPLLLSPSPLLLSLSPFLLSLSPLPLFPHPPSFLSSARTDRQPLLYYQWSSPGSSLPVCESAICSDHCLHICCRVPPVGPVESSLQHEVDMSPLQPAPVQLPTLLVPGAAEASSQCGQRLDSRRRGRGRRQQWTKNRKRH